MMKEIKKEFKYALRSGKLLILMASFMFFAVLTPLMLKVILPEILKSQLAGRSTQELSAMMNMSQLGCIQSYMGDVFEIGSIIVAFTLCGLIAQEIRDNTLVLPLCSGKRFSCIAGAKLLVFGAVLVIAQIAALTVNYAYAGVLFSFELKFQPILKGGALQGFYMVFLLTCLIMWGAILKKPIPAGFLSLITAFGLHFLGSLLGMQGYLPSGLLFEAQQLNAAFSSTSVQALFVTALLIALMTAITLKRLKRLAWNER